MKHNPILSALVLTIAARAVGAADFERVLLPVVLPAEVPGAYGSRWTSDLVARNEGSQPITITQSPGGCLITVCPDKTLAPAASVRPAVFPAFPHPGAYLYVSPSGTQVAWSLRIQDLSRDSLTWGRELPIVHERDVRTDWISLLNVPTDARFRETLRIYDFDGASGNVVRVRITPLDGTTTLSETTVALNSPSALNDPGIPGFAQIGNLTDTFPTIATAAPVVRVEITPVTAGLRFWALVSVTNNETQHVTTITPQ